MNPIIKDINLKNYIESNYKEYEDIYALEFESIEITTFEGLESLNNLEKLSTLDCNVANFTSLGLVTNLRFLEIYNCNIESLNILEKLSLLEELYIVDDIISDLTPLTSLLNLRVLCLSKNRISDITPLTTLPKLQTLMIDSNCLDTTQFCPTMQIISTLKLKGCNISYLGQHYEYMVSNLPMLEDNREFIYCLNPVKLCSIPNSGGLYFFFDKDYELLYIGKATNLFDRIKSHLYGNSNTKDIKSYFEYVRYILILDADQRELYETYYINTLKPRLNIEKTFTFESDRFSFKYLYGSKWDKF